MQWPTTLVTLVRALSRLLISLLEPSASSLPSSRPTDLRPNSLIDLPPSLEQKKNSFPSDSSVGASHTGFVSYQASRYFPNHVTALWARLNNPGYIRPSSDNWKGKVADVDTPLGAFVQFSSLYYGYRALVRNLRTYIRRGINTPRTIVDTWAPPIENSVETRNNYASHIALALFQDRNAVNRVVTEQMIPIAARAIAHFETAQPEFQDDSKVDLQNLLKAATNDALS